MSVSFQRSGHAGRHQSSAERRGPDCNQNGYFYAATQQEILDTIALLTRQISGITATITGLRYSLSRIDISGFLLQQKDRDAIE